MSLTFTSLILLHICLAEITPNFSLFYYYYIFLYLLDLMKPLQATHHLYIVFFHLVGSLGMIDKNHWENYIYSGTASAHQKSQSLSIDQM